MKLIKLFKDLQNAISDHERDFSERMFLLFAIISEITVFVAFVCDIVTHEYIGEIFVIAATLILVPAITFICLYKNKLKIAIILIVAGLAFGILPGLFFFGGGIRGGGVLWFIFAFMFVGLVTTGLLRVLVLSWIVILALVCYVVDYINPQLYTVHSREMFYIDSFISLILVGMVCFFMTLAQSRIFEDENKRAKKEAERAEELTRSQNRFFSSMSHEIRTPINSILGLNELILRDEAATDEIVKDASGIQGAGKMLLALINDILDFSKIEAGSMDIVPVDYRVGDMLSDIVNMIWLRAHDKGLKFEVSIDPRVPSVLYGDEVRIKQIIVNLLNNAVKYTAEGTIELHIESMEAEGNKVELSISISDTGMGIKKEAIPFLFDAFKRVDEEKNRNIEGTGLGLSIVKQLTELMGGTINVNSVYGEGSTFNVVLTQGVSDPTEIGELNIHNQQAARRTAYEAGFKAPEARILIVDDNEMNLEVESKLLSGTEMAVDMALSGREALELSLQYHYDAILMDHLMPEMDGIECLKQIRNQSGGLNRTTPVVVLTANAGSENREMYNHAGFDGFLVKPVSGEALENTLIRYIAQEKLHLSDRMTSMREDISTSAGYSGKLPVIITASSVADLPDDLVKKLYIPILPAWIRTEEGVFKDGVQMGADELIRYMDSGRVATSSVADEAAYTDFFAHVLKRAHHLIHIALSTAMSDDYRNASEAAKSFDNVSVVNSGCLSSSTGILVLIAHKLAQQNMPVNDILAELESIKSRLKCSFIVDKTEYMARKGFISPFVNKFAQDFNLHPSIVFKNNRFSLGGIWMGQSKRAYKKYIHKAFPVDVIPDSEIVFITYADIPLDTLYWIKEEISKIAYFEHVVFKQASAAISSNCGPGTFGILYFVKGNKSYNIASYIDDEIDSQTSEGSDEHTDILIYEDEYEDESDAPLADETLGIEKNNAPKWYDGIEGIDPDIAIQNSGSEDAFKTVLKIFYDSIDTKSSELKNFFAAADWENYTIKVHALKSSAKIIGAMDIADRAQLLEDAGKAKDSDYIRDKHEDFMNDYLKYKDILRPVFDGSSENESTDRSQDTKPVADPSLMQGVYDGLREAAEAMDCDTIEDIFKELEDYSIPESDREKFDLIIEKAGNYDYDGILEVLDNG